MKDLQWLEHLHRAHYLTLLQLARNRLSRTGGSSADAEDVVQQAFLLAGQKDISGHEAPLGWLCKTVDNLCQQHSRKRLRQLQKQQRLRQQAPVCVPPAADEAALLFAMEQALSPEEWKLLHQYCVQNIPTEELARERGVTIGALRVQIHRIRRKLRKSVPGL